MMKQLWNDSVLHFLLVCLAYIAVCEGVCNCGPGEQCIVVGHLTMCVATPAPDNGTTQASPTESTANTTDTTNTSSPRMNDACDPNYEWPSPEEHECSMFCGMGVCKDSGSGYVSCLCDPNAIGSNCLSVCCKDCGDFGRCVRNLTGHEGCQCHQSFTGEFCDIYDPFNACDTSYEPPPLSLRDCGNGLTCVNGICANATDGSVYCECDPGARNVDCSQVCCLNCGDHGTCDIDPVTGNETCVCEPGYNGQFCETLEPGRLANCTSGCCLDCGEHGSCAVNAQTGNESCVCNSGYAGQFCGAQVPVKDDQQKVTWVYWVVGACVVLLVVLILAMAVVSYVLWKKRVILVMRVVHYFQQYEDDDNREWDAVISVRRNTSEEDFVLGTLCPKLEKEMGFRVNIHNCGSKPGDEEITTEAEKSRRTIFIVSPNSKTTPECETVKQKILQMKGRVITILLDDVNVSMNPADNSLKTVLDSATSIQWPRAATKKEVDKFWTRLKLVMPKKKNKYESLNETGHQKEKETKSNGLDSDSVFVRL